MIIESYDFTAFTKGCLKNALHDAERRNTSIKGLSYIASDSPKAITNMYLPRSLWLVVEGALSIDSNTKTLPCRDGEMMIVAQDLYKTFNIVEAPFFAIDISLDLPVLRTQQGQVEPRMMDRLASDAIFTREANRDVAETMRRLLRCLQVPDLRHVLVPLIREELHYLALISEIGSALRNLSREDSHASRVAKVVAYINLHWNKALDVSDLAAHASMGASSFHSHFKKMTGTSPLQYQKSRRMFEARQLLRTSTLQVADICRQIGYESPTQFSRDYRRLYGHPPIAERTSAQEASSR